MVLRILFRQKAKKYPQNTFKVHKQKASGLCTLLFVIEFPQDPL